MLTSLAVSVVVSATLALVSNAQAFARSIVGSVPAPAPATAAVAPVRGWMTTPDGLNPASPMPTGAIALSYPASPPPGAVTVPIDSSTRAQTVDGFGASLTESAAVLLNNLPPATRQAALTDLFSPGSGASINIVRLPMGATDMSLSAYTYDDVPVGQTDPNLGRFSIGHDAAAILPVLKSALALNPKIRVIATPWSAPAWMKTNGSLFGGTLNTNRYQSYANYFAKFIRAYATQGVPIYAVAPQNEPENTNSTYPTMTLTAAQEATFVGQYLGPTLARAGYGQVKILGYEHNWNDTAYPIPLLGSSAGGYLAGTSYHCYGGDPAAQTTVHNQFPAKGIWFTECSGTLGSSFRGDLGWDTGTLLVGGVRNWAKSIMFWSLALDPSGGPHTGGCGNCRGVITVDPATTSFTPNVEHAILAQAAAAADAGATVVGSPGGSIANVAFLNPDGSRSIVANNSWTTDRMLIVQDGVRTITVTVPPGSTITLRWT